MASDKKAEYVQIEVAAMDEKNVHLLQQRRRVRINEYTLSPLALRRKGKQWQAEGTGPL